MLSLPALPDFETFRAWRSDTSRWLPVAADIARVHGLASSVPHIFSTGTNLVDAPPVILVGEYIPENFLLNGTDDEWRLAGLIDFGDVLTGFAEYDLLGPSAFMSAGTTGCVRSLFDGFGYSYTPAEINFTVKRWLMTLMLLHRASDLNRHICIEGWQQKAADLHQLQDVIWPT
jgi:hygromycin-B 7''-O-kinase